tara:strand:+ start:17 stop:625 length:609 start_codon:yes stop_codon:yes gene_type:complete
MFIYYRILILFLAITMPTFLSSSVWAKQSHDVKIAQASHILAVNEGEGLLHGKSHHGNTEGSKKSYKGHHGKGYKGQGYGKSGHHSRSSHRHYSSDPFRHMLQFKNELGLTEEQLSFIKNEKFKYEKIIIEIGATHKISHMELDRALHSENIDEDKISQIVGAMVEQKSKKLRARIAGKLAVLKKLTQSQRKQIRNMYNQHN